MHPLYNIILNDLRTDARQMIEEGHDVSALEKEVEAARATGSADALLALQQDFWGRPSPPGFGYDEPSGWEAISAGFPAPESHARFPGGEDELADRLLAAWQGRCAGCQLGKPFEGAWPEEVRQMAEASDSWPLGHYLKPIGNPARLAELKDIEGYGKRIARCQWLTKGSFDAVAPDDDIHYALVGLVVLEKHGVEFTSDQAVAELIGLTPRNFVFASGRNMCRTFGFGLHAPCTALFGNGFRQSLGAQIRCDPFGWAAPANPALAAKMAYEDARGSQIRNGIYSGIFFAVIMADALACGDPVRAIDTAEQYVPPKSRFAEMIRFTRQACDEHADWKDAMAAVYDRYDKDVYAPDRAPVNHCMINAAIVLVGLLKGDGAFGKTICITVMGGRDTDCTGATAGSIMGCALGTDGIDPRWVDPFNDTIRTGLPDMHELKITEVARRTFELARGNARYDRH